MPLQPTSGAEAPGRTRKACKRRSRLSGGR